MPSKRAINEYLAEQERRHGDALRLAPDDPQLLICKDCGAMTWLGNGKHGHTTYETRPIGHGYFHCTRKTKHFPKRCNLQHFLSRTKENDHE